MLYNFNHTVFVVIFCLLSGLIASPISAQQVNWNEVSRGVNSIVQEQSLERERQRAYFEQLTTEVKSSIEENSFASGIPRINTWIISCQIEAYERVGMFYNLLTSGQIQTSLYESDIRKVQSEYELALGVFERISNFKVRKLESLGANLSEENAFESLFSKTLAGVASISFNENNKVSFRLEGLRYRGGEGMLDLYDFVSSSCSGSYDKYIEDWEASVKEGAPISYIIPSQTNYQASPAKKKANPSRAVSSQSGWSKKEIRQKKHATRKIARINKRGARRY